MWAGGEGSTAVDIHSGVGTGCGAGGGGGVGGGWHALGESGVGRGVWGCGTWSGCWGWRLMLRL